MLAEMGVQGLLCLIWLMAAVGYKVVKCFNAAKTRLGKSIALAYLGFYVSIVFAGFFTGSFLPSAAAGGGTGPFVEASYRWMLLGLVLSIPIWEKDAAEKEQPVKEEAQKEKDRWLLRVRSKTRSWAGGE
jgi:hypothetical protein